MFATSRESALGSGLALQVGAVLQHAADDPSRPVAFDEICKYAKAEPSAGRAVVTTLIRTGLLASQPQADGSVAYSLLDPWQQRRQRMNPLVLVVEDNVAVVGLVEALLSREGYGVVAVRNPAAAHLVLRVASFDVILTDSYSPTLDLATRVLTPLLQRSAWTPVVLFTSHHWDVGRVQAEGFADIITKPFDGDAFLSRVATLAQQSDKVAGSSA